MIVCICKALTENTIREMLEYSDIELIKQTTGAGTQCQTCLEKLEELAQEIRGNEDL
jgi:bacterioferritin-associated ferredoxin